MNKIWRQYDHILDAKGKRQIAGIVVLMVIGGFLEILSVTMIIPLIAAIANMKLLTKYAIVMRIFSFLGLESEESRLIALAVGFALVIVLKNVVLYAMEQAKRFFVIKGSNETAKKLFGIYITRPYVYYLNCNSGEIITVINVLVEKIYTLLQDILTLVSKVIVVVALVVVMVLVDWKVSVLLMSVFAIMTLILYFTMYKKDEAVGDQILKCTIKMMDIVNQSVSGIKDIKVLNREKYFADKYFRHSNRVYKLNKRKFVYDTAPKYISEVVVSVCIAVYIIISITTGQELTKILVGMSAVSIAVVRIVPSVNSINSCINRIMFNKPMLLKISTEVMEYMNSPKKINWEKDPETFALREQIEFEDVSFMYPDGSEYVIRNTSLSIKKGEKIGIVGASGEGKTTFVNVLLGFLEPNEGSIKVDNANIQTNVRGWMRNIGYIPQLIFLVDDSIRNNIIFGNKKATDEKIWEVLKIVQLDKFVKALDQGLDTHIGENGIRLSGGQRQRIGIARAIFNDPDILVLDEATAALDDETERDIMNEIYGLNLDKTMIIISHRLTTLNGCNRIYRVEDGRILLEGASEDTHKDEKN